MYAKTFNLSPSKLKIWKHVLSSRSSSQNFSYYHSCVGDKISIHSNNSEFFSYNYETMNNYDFEKVFSPFSEIVWHDSIYVVKSTTSYYGFDLLYIIV